MFADLHDRPDHHERPVRPHVGGLAQHVDVKPLVDHPVEAETRMLQLGLVGGLRKLAARLGEMIAVDRGREAVDVRMAALLRFVEAGASGEDEVRSADQLALEIEQALGREAELRQLVHAVVDDRARVEVAREAEHHRRVIPGEQRPRANADMRVEQALQRRLAPLIVQPFRKVRGSHADVREILGLPNLQEWRFASADVHRLFPIDHRHGPGEAAHQMLRPLEDEVPPQVRKAQ